MSERYKVLGAALALSEFNVKELANFSNVKITTVRTIIGREQGFIEKIGRQKSKGPGGSYVRYHIKPNCIDKLRSEIDNKLFPDYLKSLSPTISLETIKPPTSLLSAEDILLRMYPEAENEEKKQDLLNLASSNLQEAKEDILIMSGQNADHPAVKALQNTILLYDSIILLFKREFNVKQRELAVTQREKALRKREHENASIEPQHESVVREKEWEAEAVRQGPIIHATHMHKPTER